MAPLNVGGLEVDFPFPPYECQLTFMEAVVQALRTSRHALLESPTGTGKTLCLLTAALAWRSAVARLSQVVAELKTARLRTRMVLLGSREQLCVHPHVSTLRGAAQNAACTSACASKTCSFKAPFDAARDGGGGGGGGGALSGSAGLADHLAATAAAGPMDIEELVAYGASHRVCPYYLAREAAADAELLLLPYNYVVDASTWSAAGGADLLGDVLVFDEAHNLPEAATTWRALRALVQDMDLAINRASLPASGTLVKPADYLRTFLSEHCLTGEAAAETAERLGRAARMVSDSPTGGAAAGIRALVGVLRVAFADEEGLFGEARGAAGGKSAEARGVRCILLASGTLSPMDAMEAELGLPFPVRVENPHVITPPQILSLVVPVGPSGGALNSSYATRSTFSYRMELGRSLANFSRVIPGGLLVFFPSYAVLDGCVAFWQATRLGSSGETMWSALNDRKAVLVETRQTGGLAELIATHAARIRAGDGSAIYAVCRGKVSEGIDFADADARAVLITGLPYPAATDPKVVLKKQAQASRAVNQAAGRAIRHVHDYGAVVFLDERFAAPAVVGRVSAWLRPHLRVVGAFPEAQASLARFFRAAAVAPFAAAGGAKAALRAERAAAAAAAAAGGGAGGAGPAGAGARGRGGRTSGPLADAPWAGPWSAADDAAAAIAAADGVGRLLPRRASAAAVQAELRRIADVIDVDAPRPGGAAASGGGGGGGGGSAAPTAATAAVIVNVDAPGDGGGGGGG
ncbi:hypothetical protein I4F81_003146 [Pyropia yezoensis]|uniref:Uncharacterized protein n=1 Tax=Pyropia yezoensis TaxID=2788 RepID=A0ACC3BRI7_PYRYE|nr:hypothetical protein I4F81_003146 [Neopyropia yezoensis]